MNFRRLKCTVAYDGRPYLGWQSQPNGQTVQDHLQGALQRICKQTLPSLQGSGRTDTGVHALGQVAHLDVPEGNRMTEGNWVRALNSHLPASIRVLKICDAEPEFHARFSAKRKTYRYEIDTGRELMPMRAGAAWHVYGEIDENRLSEMASILLGEHDFAAFAANRGESSGPASTVRTLYDVGVDRIRSDTLAIEFEGNGFLYKMVRLLTGSMIRCARNLETMDWFRELVALPEKTGTSSHCAPPDGLYLVSVKYPTAL